MLGSVEILRNESMYNLQNEINKKIHSKNVKDIKFCVNPIIKGSYGSSHSSGNEYFAMIIYDIDKWGV